MTNLSMIFHVVVSVIDNLKFETRPSSPMNCRSPFTENICTILNARAMAKKTWRHEKIILCICDQQVSFGQIMFSPPQKNFSRTLMHAALKGKVFSRFSHKYCVINNFFQQ